MPGLNASTHSILVLQHDNAEEFLECTYPTLERHETSANIILAHALKRVGAEVALASYLPFLTDAHAEASLRRLNHSSYSPHRTDDSFWLTLWSATPSGHPALELVLSCLNWTLGNYPVFLWTPRRPGTFPSDWLNPRIAQLTEHLRLCVPPERVFSVFGMTQLVKTFARRWSSATGFRVDPEPFYAAHFSYCDPTTFQAADVWLPQGHALRKAGYRDLEAVAQLCKEFADESVFFPLTTERATIEAHELIMKGQIWVYDASGDIATVCAVTRNSLHVSAITKVYTTPAWRRHGCAEFLVREVTRRILFESGKDCVVLYVGHDNNAQRVYDRVGYAGLCGKDKSDRIEDSLELGFVGAHRGHW
ncbi:uncharacterized protein C8Q71DRAFT_757440 [Rhodofomes roseus]|uniref:N-acetyltransferase domain-containing protein n=1 Tax=Rhodofomes roseus TaxID=34475 RepID=A0A4Y9YUX7_9APHY|nr:uncharacterized protein C8Q71DRAFT_757440 [Rhodofomes roseus]KAH9837251.1 hypothetical protein C8Q71DRAFT_757440 [Rhodofomes roseus]TFY64929.1 hypothetical protein EVJ58_g2291 [Rhodofomes roseus]